MKREGTLTSKGEEPHSGFLGGNLINKKLSRKNGHFSTMKASSPGKHLVCRWTPLHCADSTHRRHSRCPKVTGIIRCGKAYDATRMEKTMVFGVLTQLFAADMLHIHIHIYIHVSHELESFKRFCMFTHRKKPNWYKILKPSTVRE